ncbi:hypothetical protein KEJ15_09245 [Candidatus Bathyarchaeota archaeon]|nr:hypothetical protein [Candidatus Bathyarchaeota archaeon]
MIWMYAASGKKLKAADLTKLAELDEFGSKSDWVWVDILKPDDKESELVATLLGDEKTLVSDVKDGVYNILHMYTGYEKRHDYTLLSLPFVDLGKELEIHPIFIFIKEKMIITWGCEHCPTLIKTVLRMLKDHLNEGIKPNKYFILSRILREVVVLDSKALVSLRERIDKVAGETHEKSGKKALHTVFELKKQISSIHRLLYLKRRLLCDVKEEMIPNIRLDEEAKPVVEDAINDIDQDLEFVDSYDRGLDGILSLLNLGSIHRVEASINFLTIILVILTLILVALELAARFGEHAALSLLGLF